MMSEKKMERVIRREPIKTVAELRQHLEQVDARNMILIRKGQLAIAKDFFVVPPTMEGTTKVEGATDTKYQEERAVTVKDAYGILKRAEVADTALLTICEGKLLVDGRLALVPPESPFIGQSLRDYFEQNYASKYSEVKGVDEKVIDTFLQPDIVSLLMEYKMFVEPSDNVLIERRLEVYLAELKLIPKPAPSEAELHTAFLRIIACDIFHFTEEEFTKEILSCVPARMKSYADLYSLVKADMATYATTKDAAALLRIKKIHDLRWKQLVASA
ncbi:Hypothetical protein POVN_LOCUS253 [uncultured virus]|nr:Hypothetical protein POVN_LOCUS253 [uncultured virus]